MSKVTDAILKVEAWIEAGFTTKAAKKVAFDILNRAYKDIEERVRDEYYKFGTYTGDVTADREERFRIYCWLNVNVPSDLHNVKPRHLEAHKDFPAFAEARDLVALRRLVKDAEIVPVPRNEDRVRIERIRKSIMDEMAARKVRFVEGLNMSRIFGMDVEVNAHYVTNEHGTTFLRHFFYLNGKLRALNEILATSGILEAEKKARDGISSPLPPEQNAA